MDGRPLGGYAQTGVLFEAAQGARIPLLYVDFVRMCEVCHAANAMIAAADGATGGADLWNRDSSGALAGAATDAWAGDEDVPDVVDGSAKVAFDSTARVSIGSRDAGGHTGRGYLYMYPGSASVPKFSDRIDDHMPYYRHHPEFAGGALEHEFVTSFSKVASAGTGLGKESYLKGPVVDTANGFLAALVTRGAGLTRAVYDASDFSKVENGVFVAAADPLDHLPEGVGYFMGPPGSPDLTAMSCTLPYHYPGEGTDPGFASTPAYAFRRSTDPVPDSIDVKEDIAKFRYMRNYDFGLHGLGKYSGFEALFGEADSMLEGQFVDATPEGAGTKTVEQDRRIRADRLRKAVDVILGAASCGCVVGRIAYPMTNESGIASATRTYDLDYDSSGDGGGFVTGTGSETGRGLLSMTVTTTIDTNYDYGVDSDGMNPYVAKDTTRCSVSNGWEVVDTDGGGDGLSMSGGVFGLDVTYLQIGWWAGAGGKVEKGYVSGRVLLFLGGYRDVETTNDVVMITVREYTPEHVGPAPRNDPEYEDAWYEHDHNNGPEPTKTYDAVTSYFTDTGYYLDKFIEPGARDRNRGVSAESVVVPAVYGFTVVEPKDADGLASKVRIRLKGFTAKSTVDAVLAELDRTATLGGAGAVVDACRNGRPNVDVVPEKFRLLGSETEGSDPVTTYTPVEIVMGNRSVRETVKVFIGAMPDGHGYRVAFDLKGIYGRTPAVFDGTHPFYGLV